MTFADQIRDHQSRCRPHLLRLWLVVQGEATLAPRQIVAEVRDTTNAILAEAETAVRAALAAAADKHREPATETFLWARLARLADAADEAVSAASSGYTSGLRSRLRRFDELTSAIWTVQHAMYDQVPLPRPADPRTDGRRAGMSGCLGSQEGLRPRRWGGRNESGCPSAGRDRRRNLPSSDGHGP